MTIPTNKKKLLVSKLFFATLGQNQGYETIKRKL